MYVIKRNNKRFGKHTFKTYEQARAYVRKFIRKEYSMDEYDNAYFRGPFVQGNEVYLSMWDGVSRNPPAIGVLGFKIMKNGTGSGARTKTGW